jgi:hypothetical protein
LVGQVLGGLVGAQILIKIKAGFVRLILIGIMFFTSFGLVCKGLNLLGVIGKVPVALNGAVFLGIMIIVVRGVVKQIKSGG